MIQAEEWIYTLFHKILLATARGLASTAISGWHLKVKDREYDVGLTKNYCILVNMQKSAQLKNSILRNSRL